jgi:glycosyltransferase involved in cell wall biosynthesis
VIRVLFDAHQLGRRQTGNETYIRELLPRLLEEPDLDIVAAVERGLAPADSPVPRSYLRRVPRNGVGRLGALTILARQERADLVHAIYFLPPATGRRTVVTIHDISFELFPEFFSRAALIRNRTLIRASARAASRVITVSEASRRDIVEHYGLPEDKVVAIHNGVSAAFKPGADWVPFPGDRPLRVLAVGSLEPRKNLLRLIDALDLVGRDIPISLRLVGPDGYRATAIRDRLSPAVATEIVGWVSADRLADEYRAADVFAYPSVYEGFGLPVVEAMASGTPVVSSTGGSIPEITGDAAVLVDPVDVAGLAGAIRMIASNPDSATALRARGLARAANFSWDRSAALHVAVYRGLV